MNMRFARLGAMLIAIMMIGACALAQETIRTTVVMRVSHMTQNAVVDAGEDLSIEVNIDGVDPAAYQWYFNDAPIKGETQKVLNIVDAQPEDAGIYRLDAFNADGAMVVSMDIAARVVDKTVPQSGDGSLPVGWAMAGFAACAAALAAAWRRRQAI